MNLSYIDWYLVEIRRRLHGLLTLDHLNSFEFETRGHLQSLVEEFVEHGMDRRSAEIAAIERFGTPDNIAEQCVLRFQRQQSRILVFIAGLIFAVFILIVPFNQDNYALYTYGSQPLWIILGFAIFALILGRVPKFAWFAFPVVALVGLSVLNGYRNTFYSPVSLAVQGSPFPYGELRQRYGALRTENESFGTIEHDAAESWRSIKANAKDLGKGQDLTIPQLNYKERNGHLVYYADRRMSTRDSVTSTAGESGSSTIILDNTMRIAFRYAPVRTAQTLSGPLSVEDIRKVAQTRITEVQSRRAWRNTVVTGMQKSLYIPVATRIWSMAQSHLGFYVCVIGPASYLVTLVIARFRSRIRFKQNRMKLA